MRILLATAVAIAPLMAATGAMAEVVITTVRTTPITTSNAGGTGVADDIRISGSGGITVLAALRLQLAHLGAHVVGRQLVSTSTNSAKDASIADLIHRLQQLQPLQP